MLRAVGLSSILCTLGLLLSDHLIDHGRDLNPVNHWLSEYVLSHSSEGVWLMRLAFVALAVCAFAVAAAARHRVVTSCLAAASIGLIAMPFFDSAPNDGRSFAFSWPMTAANVHQLALYVAIGAALAGMALDAIQRRRFWPWLAFSIAGSATLAQTALVAASASRHVPTPFGGLTERVVVLAMLAWATEIFVSRQGQNRPAAPTRRMFRARTQAAD